MYMCAAVVIIILVNHLARKALHRITSQIRYLHSTENHMQVNYYNYIQGKYIKVNYALVNKFFIHMCMYVRT